MTRAARPHVVRGPRPAASLQAAVAGVGVGACNAQFFARIRKKQQVRDCGGRFIVLACETWWSLALVNLLWTLDYELDPGSVRGIR